MFLSFTWMIHCLGGAQHLTLYSLAYVTGKRALGVKRLCSLLDTERDFAEVRIRVCYSLVTVVLAHRA